MDIKQLKRFLDLCETKSFTKTASNMYLSQQALSSSINSLETEIDKLLFDRTSKGIVLTDDGAVLKELCEPLVQHFDDMLAELSRRYDSKREQFILGLAPAVLRASCPDIIHRFKMQNPFFKLKVIESMDTVCVDNVKSGVVEVAFCPRPQHDTDTEYIHMGAEGLYAVVSKENHFAGRASLSVADLKDEKLVSLNRYYQVYHTITRCCNAHAFEPNIIVDSSESGIFLNLVKTYKYVYICTEYLASDADRNDFVVLPFSDEDMIWEYGLVHRKGGKLSRGANIFIEFINRDFFK